MTPALQPPIERLPTEIELDIGAYLTAEEISKLVQCNKHLRRRFQQVLYDTASRRNQATLRSCQRGLVDSLERAILQGGPIHFVQITQSGVDHQVPTLLVALKHGHINIFQHLISRGASLLSDEIDLKQRQLGIQSLIKKLCCNKASSPFLDAFLASGVFTECKSVSAFKNLSIPLSTLVKNQYPLPTMTLAIASSDKIDQLSSKGVHQRGFYTPLTASILSNTPRHFEHLVNSGADIRGPVLTAPTRDPLHIPMFAATYKMADAEYSKSMVAYLEYLIQHGCDIKEKALVKTRKVWLHHTNNSQWGEIWQLEYTTPLLTYLSSLNLSTHARQISNDDVIPAIGYLLSNGADLGSPTSNSLRRDRSLLFVRTPSAVEMLIRKWGVPYLRHTGFHQVIHSLISRGGANGYEAGNLLDHFNYNSFIFDDPSTPGMKHFQLFDGDDAIECRFRPLSYLIAALAGFRTPLTNPTELLAMYMMQALWLDVQVGRPFESHLDYLIEIGADVNALYPVPGVKSIFHFAAEWWAFRGRRERGDWLMTPEMWLGQNRRQLLCQLMLRKGFNAQLEVDGETALRVFERAAEEQKPEGRQRIRPRLQDLMKANFQEQQGYERRSRKLGEWQTWGVE